MSNTRVLMRIRDLNQQLACINDHRRTAARIDEQTIDALGELITDIGRLLDHSADVENMRDTARDIVVDRQRMAKRISQFPTRDPRVANILSEVSEVLNMISPPA